MGQINMMQQDSPNYVVSRSYTMLTEYVRAAMDKAAYEMLSDRTFYGEIPGFQGVYANEATLEACREELRQVLEGWIVLGLQMGHSLPVVEGIDLTVKEATG